MEKKKTYQEAVDFLESLINIPVPEYFFTAKGERRKITERKIFIKRLNYLLKLINNPEENLKFIHITGTAGKTSTTFFVSSILQAAGFKVGSFISPHITSITERIRLGDKFIASEELSEIVEYLKPYLTQCAVSSPHGCPSFFETMLAVAFVYFKNNKCDYVVLEAGCGGLLDATNVIKKTEVAIITNVGLDHTSSLGETKEAIALDKAGIIKRGCLFFTAERNEKIYKIFEKICQTKKVPFRRINGDYKILKNDLTGTEFEYEREIFKTKLIGEHQAGNAVLAFEAVREIIGDNYKAMKKGVAEVFVPCRLEKMPDEQLIILDGAHNVDKMKTTANFVKRFKYCRLHLIVGLAANKDADGILKEIVPLADEIYLTRFLHNRRRSQYFRKMKISANKFSKKKTSLFIDPQEALLTTRKNAGPQDLILVTGSFFLTGELRSNWYSEDYILKKRKMI